ncbi:flocculation protein FLO11-like isoform X3 [Haliotis rufescens]|uniref:flocculation protein FLO11-like isoform X3 n=1 Tax=Haliotis rufescens TaxID=6454 RepID=UPI00201EDBC5|nr:flocculation protein FLO11-like isoform X3 [Haliotis rufescens]
MEIERNYTVRLNIVIYMFLLIINSSKGAVCPTPDNEENIVRSMCLSGQISGKRVYLDTSYFSSNMDTCTCSITATGSGGSVTFSFPVVDSVNCDATIVVSSFNFIRNCSSGGSYSGFLDFNATVDLKLEGSGPVSHCMLVYTEAAEMMLAVSCYAATTVATPMTTEQITTTLEVIPPTTFASTTQGTSAVPVSSPTSQISTTEEVSSPTSSVFPTEPLLPVTEENQLAVCPQSDIPVVGMCRAGIQQGTRIYLDSTLFSGEFSRCSCSLRVVSAAGGSVDIYPSTIDRKNCKVSFNINVLKYSLDCHKSNDHAQSFLHSLDSLDLDIRGQGAGRYCLLIQTKATEVRLQLQCYSGRFADSVNTTTSTTTYTPETPFVTTEAMVTSTSTPTPSTTTSATTPVSITEAPTTTVQPTTEKTHKTTTVTSSAPSTSTITTEVLPTSPTEITPVPVTVPSQTTTTTTVSESTGLDNKTVLDDTQATRYSFPVVEVTAGVSAGIMVLLGIMVILLCNRFQDKHRGDEEDERKQPIAGYADSEYSSANVSVLNPLYSEEAEPECSQQARQRPEEHGSDVSSSSSESPPSPSAGRTVTEVNAGQVELTYALVIKPNRGHSNCTEPPGRTKTEGSTHGLYRL